MDDDDDDNVSGVMFTHSLSRSAYFRMRVLYAEMYGQHSNVQRNNIRRSGYVTGVCMEEGGDLGHIIGLVCWRCMHADYCHL